MQCGHFSRNHADRWVQAAVSGERTGGSIHRTCAKPNRRHRKKLSECERVDDRIFAVLTQEETLKLDAKKPVEVQLRVRLLTGTALATDPESVPAGRILRDGVI